MCRMGIMAISSVVTDARTSQHEERRVSITRWYEVTNTFVRAHCLRFHGPASLNITLHAGLPVAADPARLRRRPGGLRALAQTALPLDAGARRHGAGFHPHAPQFSLDPQLTLALFVAPALLDAAFDTSLRDLKRYWIPVMSLVFIAVGLTTAAVAWLVHYMVPGMPWAAAVAIGAIVAPPDAVAASAVMRRLNIPHRVLVILEGESLLNDATALLIYRLAVTATMGATFSGSGAAMLSLAMVGSAIVGFLLAHGCMRMMAAHHRYPQRHHHAVRDHVRHVDIGGRARPLAHRDPGGLRDHRGAPLAAKHAGSDAHALLRGVGDGGVRAQRAGLRAHRSAAAADLRITRARRTRITTCRSRPPCWAR